LTYNPNIFKAKFEFSPTKIEHIGIWKITFKLVDRIRANEKGAATLSANEIMYLHVHEVKKINT
jgi:hypothetical protein